MTNVVWMVSLVSYWLLRHCLKIANGEWLIRSMQNTLLANTMVSAGLDPLVRISGRVQPKQELQTTAGRNGNFGLQHGALGFKLLGEADTVFKQQHPVAT